MRVAHNVKQVSSEALLVFEVSERNDDKFETFLGYIQGKFSLISQLGFRQIAISNRNLQRKKSRVYAYLTNIHASSYNTLHITYPYRI